MALVATSYAPTVPSTGRAQWRCRPPNGCHHGLISAVGLEGAYNPIGTKCQEKCADCDEVSCTYSCLWLPARPCERREAIQLGLWIPAALRASLRRVVYDRYRPICGHSQSGSDRSYERKQTYRSHRPYHCSMCVDLHRSGGCASFADWHR